MTGPKGLAMKVDSSSKKEEKAKEEERELITETYLKGMGFGKWEERALITQTRCRKWLKCKGWQEMAHGGRSGKS